MITTFAVRYESLRFTKTNAAYLTSLFWAFYTLSRMVSTGLSLKFSPAKLIVLMHVIYVAAAVTLFLFIDYSPIVTWTCTAALAFGVSPYWANGTAWVVQYIQLTPRAMSVAVIIISSGVMTIPFIIGNRIEQYPTVFLYTNLSLAILLTVAGISLIIYGRTRTLRLHRQRLCAMTSG